MVSSTGEGEEAETSVMHATAASDDAVKRMLVRWEKRESLKVNEEERERKRWGREVLRVPEPSTSERQGASNCSPAPRTLR